MNSESNNKNQIIDFEEIFKETNESRVPEKPRNSNRSIITLLIYFFLFLFGIGSVIATVFVLIVFPKSSSYTLISNLNEANNPHLVSIMHKDEYINEVGNFKDLEMVSIEFDEPSLMLVNYVLIIKGASEEQLLFLNEPNTISNILLGKTKYWPGDDFSESEHLINITYHYNSPFYKSNSSYINNNKQYILVSQTNVQQVIVMFITYLIVLIPLIILYKKDISDDFFALKRDYHPATAKILSSFSYYIVISLVLGLLSSNLASLFPGGDNVAVNQSSIDLMLNSQAGLLMLFTIVFLGPVVEELVFRKALFDVVKNQKVAFHLSALSFGLIHLSSELIGLFMNGSFSLLSLLQVIVLSLPYVGMGYFLSYWYKKHNYNITLLIIIHALGNLISGIGIFL